MKSTFTFFAAFLFSMFINAAHSQSKISISSFSNAGIRVMIDGDRYNVVGNTITLNNIRPGFHVVKVYQQRRFTRGSGGIGNSQAGSYQVVYSSRINVRTRYHVDIVVNRFGRAFYDERPIYGDYFDEDDWGDTNDPNWNNNDEFDPNNEFNNNRPMSVQSFERFKESLKNESFDNTRMNIAKQVIADNWVTTAQVRQIMDFFSFENSKLDIAKYAFKYTVDRRDYFSLADAFTFSGNKDELMRYIQANR